MSRDAETAILSADRMRTLACVLDEIVPPSDDGRLPGAGELGLAAGFEEAVEENAELGPVLEAGLASLEELARGRGAPGFGALPRDERLELLNQAGARAPLFLPSLMGPTFVGYYQHARVREALGLETRPPYPEGYAVEPTDFSILDPVRRRRPLYRAP